MRKCFYLELLIRNWSLSKMSLLQIDDSSRQWWKKEKNVGIVWLCLFPFASIFKTEKAQRAAVRNCNQKILQKWIRSCYNKITASWKILKKKQNKTQPYFFHFLALSVSQCHSILCVACPSSIHDCQSILLVSLDLLISTQQHGQTSILIPFFPSHTPFFLSYSLSFLCHHPSSLHFNQGSFLIKTNKYEEAINILKEADGGIVPFRYYMKP